MTAFLYRHFDKDGVLLYVGISNHVGRRTDDHAKHSSWFERIARIDVAIFADREAALAAERAAIVAEKPVFNIVHKAKSPPPLPADISRDKTTRSVLFRPLYDIRQAAEELGLSAQALRIEIQGGALGSFEMMRPRAKHPKTYITGWQLIDWLETRK